MLNISTLSDRIAHYITLKAEFDSSQTDSVRYGIEIILIAVFKGITILSIAYLLGILSQVTVALICGISLRLVSGGAHCTGYFRCLLLSTILFISVGIVAVYFERSLYNIQTTYILYLCFIMMITVAFFWAPGEVSFRIISNDESHIYKVLTIILLFFWMITAIFFSNQIQLSFIFAGLQAMLIQTVSFTPFGNKAINKIDSFLLSISLKKGGV